MSAMPTAVLFMLALPWATPCQGSRPAGPTSADANSIVTAHTPSDDANRTVVPRTGEAEQRLVGGPKGAGIDDDGWLRTLGALGIVAGLIFAARWLLKRWHPSALSGAAGPVEVLARAAVAPRQQVVLVRLGARLVLVGTGGGAMSTLAEVTDPAEVRALIDAVKSAAGKGIAGLLAGLGRGGSDPKQ